MILPQEIGLPPKFTQWRNGQEKVITDMLYPEGRYSTHAVPTGGGKTICYVSSAKVSNRRTLILTSTKGLQDQLNKDFGDIVTIVKGQSAYKCRLSDDKFYCNTGSCHWRYPCPYKESGCRYREAIREAQSARIVVTNYSFWMSNPPEVLGDFGLLIMDEAHDAAEHLLGALSMEIKKDEASRYIHWPEEGATTTKYYEWAKVLRGIIDDEVKAIDPNKKYKRGSYTVLALQQKLQLMDKIWVDNWVVEHKGNSITWDVIWPAPLAQAYLFRNIPRVILTSATVTKADLIMLGIQDQSSFIEYPSVFRTDRRRILFMPTERMDRYITTAGMNAWATRIDHIIASRLAYKGIIHTVSYERAKRICSFSGYKDFMMSHDSRGTAEAIVSFKQAESPAILVSPSMVTGYDFPNDEARWQIIGKVPFPDSRPMVMKARQKVNPDYGCYLAIKQLIQASGRIVRSPEDWGDTFIIDSHFQWVFNKYRNIIPKWWANAVTTTRTIPKETR